MQTQMRDEWWRWYVARRIAGITALLLSAAVGATLFIVD
jgi:hypothetical protein